MRDGLDNFPSYAGAELFAWLNGTEKPSGIDVKQDLPIDNCERQKLFATTTLCAMYQLLTSGAGISQDTVQEDGCHF